MNKCVWRIHEIILATGIEVRIPKSVFIPTYTQQTP
jgi:hypothetical protein